MTGAIVPWSSQGRFSNCFVQGLSQKGRPPFSSRPAPMAILFSSAPMAKGDQGQPKGHFVQAAPVAILSRQMAVSSKPIAALPKPMAILSKPAATAIYQGQPQYQLYDGCSGKGKPVGLALGGPSRYCADLIEAGPDCQFIKANSNRKGQPLDLVLEARPAIAPRKQFISSRLATVLIEAGPDGGQLQPEGPTLRSSPRRPDPLLRRISSLSTAGRPRF